MNIENEVKSILRMEIQPSEKVFLIQRFTNFDKEDIEEAVRRKYNWDASTIYRELLILDNRRKMKKWISEV